MDLEGRTALVTGGAHRVGRVIAAALAERGCNLVVHFHQSADAAEQTAAQLRNLGVRASIAQADLSRQRGIEDLFKSLDETRMELDLWVNSAAIMQAGDILSTDEADWNRTIDLNLKSVYFCTQQAALRMKDRGGVIIQISDIAGVKPWPRFPIHSISKAGVEMLTKVAALALAPKIRVNAVAPGPVLKPENMPESRWQEIVNSLPLGRAGAAEDVAKAVVFLAENDYITGETLVVDGGNQFV